MKEKIMNMLLSARLAMRKEDADVLASTDYSWRFDKAREKWSLRDENGRFSQENVIEMHDDIAVIKIDGPLSYRSDDWSVYMGLDTYDSIERAFDKCVSDDKVKGIILDINSPGGSVNGNSDLSDKIFAARGSKPYGIVSRTGGLMCSAAYWIGSSCEKVYCGANASLGCIGTLVTFSKVNDGIVSETTIVSDLSPDKVPDPETPEGISLIKKELNELAQVFINAVARNRGTTPEDVKMNFGRGGVFIGENAVAAKLADGVISLDDICKQMKKGNKYNGGAFMATNVNPAGAKASVDVEAAKKEAVEAYKARITGIEAVFAGLEVSAEEKQKFIDEENSVAEASAFALDKAKSTIKAQSEELAKVRAELASSVSKAEEAEKKAVEAEKKAESGLSDEQKRLIKLGMEHEASSQNGVAGGFAGKTATAEQKHEEAVRRASENFYKNRR